jgi:DUF971 family protein
MKPILIKHIEQKNNHAFSITWSNGTRQEFLLSDLQRRCPCANCIDETTGQPLPRSSPVNKDVKALYIKSVGRYALQIQFTSGCSNGIYSFDRLSEMKE